uniref:Aminoacyl-transfer RNA synthetases class-II family profile domain-containing protein n=1 Tax=Plectus sambesii TaxID=2011161 RepID=A0A914WPU4_9BILA
MLGRITLQRCSTTLATFVRCCPLSAQANSFTYRTHTCGELRRHHAGEKVTVCGWVEFNRLNRFVVIRDAYGHVQAFVPDGQESISAAVKNITYESVVKVTGTVTERADKHKNPKMVTGDVQVDIDSFEVLNTAPATLPVSLRKETEVSSDSALRLKYRYLDLRKPQMQQILRFRANLVHRMRRYLTEEASFVEVETPTLFRRTPGGAAEFVVPAGKPNIGRFYSLPQSPQQFKQLLMVGGLDRYFQVARCYRDEGSKLDRQPEFTQVDLELSFTNQEGVIALIEQLVCQSWPDEMTELRPSAPFERMTYADAMRLYGVDKPDLRVNWQIEDISASLSSLKKESNDDWCARVIVAKGAAKSLSSKWRKEAKRLIGMNKFAQPFAVCTLKDDPLFKAALSNQDFLREKLNLQEEDAAVICWGTPADVQKTLGQLRTLLIEATGVRNQKKMVFLWVVDFPLFDREEDDQLVSAHHPFTAPAPGQERLLFDGNPEEITAQHYDLVLNGVEVGGGSIRIHDAATQRHVLKNILREDST